MEPERGDSFPSGPGRDPAALGEDKLPSAERKSFHISTTRTTPGRKTQTPRVDTAPQVEETPTPLGGG